MSNTTQYGWWDFATDKELVALLNNTNRQNNMYIPTIDVSDLQNKYAKLLNDYTVLSDNYKEAMIEQKVVLEKCIKYQDDIIELQDKYSKLQEEYIKLTHYVFDGDNNNEEINKIKIG